MSSNGSESQNTVNKKNTKDAIRVVYQKMSTMMDMIARETLDYGYSGLFSEYEDVYMDMITTLHKSMLDIPIDIYFQLEAIAENELHAYMYRFPESGTVIWDLSEYTEFLEEIKKKRPDYSEDFYQMRFMEKVVKDFYRKMRELLKDYLVE